MRVQLKVQVKRLLCIILALLLAFCFVSCGTGETGDNSESSSSAGESADTNSENDNNSDSENEDETEIQAIKNTVLTLAYNSDDGLDPYEMKTEINKELSALLYDPLYTINSEFSPVAVLAKEGTVDGKTVKIKLKKGVKFSDSTTVSASDVVYSYNKAKDSDGYGEQLKNFASAYAQDTRTVVFKLESADVYALNCLTFPIVKYGSAENKKAVGSGRYYLSLGKLKANTDNARGEKLSFSKISLYDVKDGDTLFGLVQVGEINFAFDDLRDCESQRVSATEKTVQLNNLVYIGLKTTKGILKDAKLRNIISLAIGRADIVASSFKGNATAAYTPFNPAWSDAPKSDEKEYSAKEIAALLDENGWAYRNDTDKHRKNDSGKELVLTLAVNKDNAYKLDAAKSIKSDLQIVGIEVNIVELSQKELKKAIKKNKYDMYIGEIKLTENMSLSPFFEENGAAAYSIDKNLSCIAAYNKLLSGKISTDEFVSAFNSDTPYIPLCYRTGVAVISNSLQDTAAPCAGDVYCDICGWEFRF